MTTTKNKPWDGISGWMTDEECFKLQELAREKSVLEIGCYQGRSSVAMLSTANHVTSIDTFKGDRDTRANGGISNFLPKAIENTEQYREKSVIICGDFFQVVPRLNMRMYSLFFYDASHTYSDTMAAMVFFQIHALAKNAPIVLHDYSDHYPQVKRAINVFTHQFDWGLVEPRVGSLAVLLPQKRDQK